MPGLNVIAWLPEKKYRSISKQEKLERVIATGLPMVNTCRYLGDIVEFMPFYFWATLHFFEFVGIVVLFCISVKLDINKLINAMVVLFLVRSSPKLAWISAVSLSCTLSKRRLKTWVTNAFLWRHITAYFNYAECKTRLCQGHSVLQVLYERKTASVRKELLGTKLSLSTSKLTWDKWDCNQLPVIFWTVYRFALY